MSPWLMSLSQHKSCPLTLDKVPVSLPPGLGTTRGIALGKGLNTEQHHHGPQHLWVLVLRGLMLKSSLCQAYMRSHHGWVCVWRLIYVIILNLMNLVKMTLILGVVSLHSSKRKWWAISKSLSLFCHARHKQSLAGGLLFQSASAVSSCPANNAVVFL